MKRKASNPRIKEAERGRLRSWMKSDVSTTDLAWMLGITRPTLMGFINKGTVVESKRHRYHLRDSVAAVYAEQRAKTRAKTPRHEASAGERSRLTRAQADMAEMTRGVMAGDLLPHDWVEENYARLAMLFTQRLMAMPDNIAPRLAKHLKDGKRFEEVRDILRTIATEAAEEVSALEIDYEERPLSYRASGQARGPWLRRSGW